ncbi:excinuclease ATPase subunit [Schlegelella sp. S2-27]|uniref:Excinuclease ATPase subunit n=1 Tax=Caldimonas mangrovi TaxID=2944811 RepID=A0ABT0YWF9_9BURK|nr:excinuclease ATPase subunit [Caldimonas mangrovi]MCM5682682.1 excinuclease ATPase subunit [Caldimonas mangrovi]
MRRFLTLTFLAAACGLAAPAYARDTEYKLPLADVLEMPEAKEKLDGSVKFFLAGQKTPKVIERKGHDVSNRKTNGVGKADEQGCKWAALSALIAFQEKAKQKGANAVVDIVSYHKKNVFESATEYECHAGAVVIGVTLKGTYAKVGEK